MGHSQNALWVHPFCQLRGLREKCRNVKTATDPANQIAVMQIHTLLGLWPMKNRICDTTRENTWICCGKSRPAAGDLKMDEKDIMAVGNQPILFDQFLYRPEPGVGSSVTGGGGVTREQNCSHFGFMYLFTFEAVKILLAMQY